MEKAMQIKSKFLMFTFWLNIEQILPISLKDDTWHFRLIYVVKVRDQGHFSYNCVKSLVSSGDVPVAILIQPRC